MAALRTTRRSFIAASAAFVALKARGDEKPLWTAGIVTDTHVKRTRESCDRVRLACELFAERNVDLVVNCGDIADRHYPEAYPILRELTDAAFPSKPPRKIWVYANHDRMDRVQEPWRKVYEDVRRLLGGEHGLFDVVEMRGYPLVVLPQYADEDVPQVEKMLRGVCADPKYAGKPVLLFDHVPPRFTTDSSATWGSAVRRELYSKFPRLVHVCGHAHSSLRSELNVWQGEFTVVGMGCLSTWGGHAVGLPPPRKQNYGAVVLEVFADRLVFRRFDVRTRMEYMPEAPWTIPLPFDPATAPYRRDRAAAAEPLPQFPAGAALSLKADAPFTSLAMTFPRAEGAHGTYLYKVQVFSPDGERLSRCDMFGQFHLPEGERAATVVRMLSAAHFDPGRKYAVRVTPCNCFGRGGRPLEAEFVAPEAGGGFKTVFESANPMEECPFLPGLSGGERIKARDGWYELGPEDCCRLEFPDGIWKGRGRFRFTVDMETEQKTERTFTVVLRNPVPLKNANGRVATPCGDSGKMRYVIEIDKDEPDFFYYLLVRESDGGRVRFSRVRIERANA